MLETLSEGATGPVKRGPALKRSEVGRLFSGALKRSFPLLKQGAPTGFRGSAAMNAEAAT
jgi:hypothetical protein